jgi:hypothetical protein
MNDRHVSRFFSFLLLLGLVCSAAHAVTLDIIVVERTDEKTSAIENAMIYADGNYQGRTDKDGILTLTVPGFQPVPLRVVKAGFDDAILSPDLNETVVLVNMARKNVTVQYDLFDADILTPIQNAEVTISAENISVSRSTDENGTARLKVLGENTYTVQARAQGYQTRTSSLEVGIEPVRIQWVMMNENRLSFVIRAADTALPVSGATVTIDGRPRGKTDENGVLSIALPRGRSYDIVIKAPGYREFQEKRQVTANEAYITETVEPSLEELTVSVFSDERQPVQGASVLINGNTVGTTSQFGMARIPSIRPGDYLIEVRAPGYHDLVKKLTVQEKSEDVVFELSRLTGTVGVGVIDQEGQNLAGVPVLVDGRTLGATNESGVILLPVKTFSRYEVEAVSEGYRSNRTVLVVNESVILTQPPIVLSRETDWTPAIIATVVGITAVVVAGILLIRWKNRKSGKKGYTVQSKGGL